MKLVDVRFIVKGGGFEHAKILSPMIGRVAQMISETGSYKVTFESGRQVEAVGLIVLGAVDSPRIVVIDEGAGITQPVGE